MAKTLFFGFLILGMRPLTFKSIPNQQRGHALVPMAILSGGTDSTAASGPRQEGEATVNALPMARDQLTSSSRHFLRWRAARLRISTRSVPCHISMEASLRMNFVAKTAASSALAASIGGKVTRRFFP
jgi:hypothetical protein